MYTYLNVNSSCLYNAKSISVSVCIFVRQNGAGLITPFLFKDNGMLMTTSKKHCYCAGSILSFHIIVPHRESKEQNNYFSRQTREEGSKGELKKPGLAEETVIMKNLLASIWLNITRGQFCNRMIEGWWWQLHAGWPTLAQWVGFPLVDFEMVTSHRKNFCFFASVGANLTPKSSHNCWEQCFFINLDMWLTFIRPGKKHTIHSWWDVLKFDSDQDMVHSQGVHS